MPERETRPTFPSRKTWVGMIPTLALPGENAPGQFGPSSVTPRARTYAYTSSISCAAMPSAMQITVSMPASTAS